MGLRVWTNEFKQGTITKVADDMDEVDCGYYCPSWHEVQYDDGKRVSMNCDRLTTRKPF